MNSNQVSAATRHQASPGVNPFARALAEAKGGQATSDQFGNSLDGLNSSGNMLNESSRDPFEEQRLMREQQKKNELRMKLHREVNPVENHDIFIAEQANVKKQIDEIKHELKLLSAEMDGFQKEVVLTLETNVASPGKGVYYFSFFQKLKEFIMLLRQRIHSARTWANTWNKKKKHRQNAMGMEIGGKSYEQTSTIQDMMTNSERNTAYAGS